MSDILDNMRFHHIGIATKNAAETAKAYAQMGGGKISKVIYDPVQNVNISWLESETKPLIEFLEPVDEKSPVNKILEKNGVTPYHLCFAVESLDEAIKELRREKFVLVSKPAPAPAIDMNRVAFLFHKDTGLIELVEQGL